MAALSQLAKFAQQNRPRTEPGVEVIDTPRYVMRIAADFPIPGPNSVSFVRCEAAEVGAVVREVEAIAARRNVPISWVLDPDTRPSDLGDRLQSHGFVPDGDPEVAVMVLPAEARLDSPPVAGLAIENGLADLDAFTASERVAAEAFAGVTFGDPTPIDGLRERRFASARATDNARHVLATIDGEPAGSASVRLYAPDGAIINGGAVRPRFRGRGVYRAMVAARLEMARDAGAAGLAVWGGHMSAPILARLGFQPVSWRRLFVKAAT